MYTLPFLGLEKDFETLNTLCGKDLLVFPEGRTNALGKPGYVCRAPIPLRSSILTSVLDTSHALGVFQKRYVPFECSGKERISYQEKCSQRFLGKIRKFYG